MPSTVTAEAVRGQGEAAGDGHPCRRRGMMKRHKRKAEFLPLDGLARNLRLAGPDRLPVL